MITTVSRTGSGQVFPSQPGGTGAFVQFNTIVSNDLGTESFVQREFDPFLNLTISFPYTFPDDGIRITFSGLYYITAGISFAAQTQLGINRLLYIWRSDITQNRSAAYYAASSHTTINNTSVHLMNVSTSMQLFEGDVLRVFVSQASSVTTTTTSATSATTGCFDAFLTAALIIQ